MEVISYAHHPLYVYTKNATLWVYGVLLNMNMNDADEKRIAAMIKDAVAPIRKIIEEHNVKHEQDMEELKPYLQFASGLGIFYRFLIAVGSLAAAYLAIKEALPHITVQ